MEPILPGVRIVEVAGWTFVPAAGAVLADWGADVIKVEHPSTGDPQRGLVSVSSMGSNGDAGVNLLMEQANRGKRSIGLDISTPEGREILYRLVETADVYLTSMLPKVRQRLQVDVEHLRARNPNLVYVRGSAVGSRGAEADDGGFDTTSYWARGGLADAMSPTSGDAWPAPHRPGIGDNPGAMMIAGGIAAALLRRERSGIPSVVDVSLLGCAMWTIGYDIIGSQRTGRVVRIPREEAANPLANVYRTSDGRAIMLSMLQADRYLAELCALLGRPELADDPRFNEPSARSSNRVELIALFDETFATRTLDEWRATFAPSSLIWSVCQSAPELYDDPQVAANGYLRTVPTESGSYALVANPVQFDEQPPELGRAPAHGEHTDEVLLSLGMTWDEVVDHKVAGTIL